MLETSYYHFQDQTLHFHVNLPQWRNELQEAEGRGSAAGAVGPVVIITYFNAH